MKEQWSCWAILKGTPDKQSGGGEGGREGKVYVLQVSSNLVSKPDVATDKSPVNSFKIKSVDRSQMPPEAPQQGHRKNFYNNHAKRGSYFHGNSHRKIETGLHADRAHLFQIEWRNCPHKCPYYTRILNTPRDHYGHLNGRLAAKG